MLRVKKMIQTGHAKGKDRLLLNAENLLVNLYKIWRSGQSPGVGFMAGAGRKRRTVPAKTAVPDGLKAFSGMPYLNKPGFWIELEKSKYRRIIINKNIVAGCNEKYGLNPA